MFILLPSSTGICSVLPYSSSSTAKRRSCFSPWSLNIIDLPLKKILNRHSLRTILLLCLGFGLIDAILPVFWDSYATASKLLKVFGSLIAAGVPLVFFISRRKRRMLAEVEGEPVELGTPELSLEEREREARKLVEDLADSVCPRAR